VRITIEGHCDERGTREYNLALGERRANAAKDYLISLGVNPGRVKTISYGKERPVAMGSNEAAWAQNRRAVTVVTTAGT
jgi:peptidoglycan-associated lipoprotein